MKQRFNRGHNILYEFANELARKRRELTKTRKFRAVAIARANKLRGDKTWTK